MWGYRDASIWGHAVPSPAPQKLPDHVVRQRVRRRIEEPLRIFEIGARDPSRFLYFRAVDDQSFVRGFRKETDHEGRRKRPRLRAEIAEAADAQAELFT